jgi:WD40 repeat protein
MNSPPARHKDNDQRTPTKLIRVSVLGWVGLLSLCQAAPAQVPVALKGHESTITTLATDPQTALLASGSKDGTVRIWNWKKGTCLVTLEGHRDMVTALAFSPNGKKIASAGHEPEIYLWDVESGKRLATWKGHAKDVRGLQFAPDGKLLASASVDHTVKLWDAATGEVRATLEGHEAEVNCVAFSPDGKTIASGSWDNTIRTWDVASGKPRRIHRGATEFIREILYPSADEFISCGKDGVIRIWNPEREKPHRTLEGHSGLVRSIALAPDRKELASVSRDGNLFLWDFAKGTTLVRIEEGTLGFQVVVYLDQGRKLATGGIDRQIRIWDVSELKAKKR